MNKLELKKGVLVGKLLFLEDLGLKKGIRFCLFECPECKNEFSTYLTVARHSGRKSCGCLRSASKTKHGQSKDRTVEYTCWSTMKSRCYNVNDKNYKRYGGRGIIVCDRWIESFSDFFKDMGVKTSKYHSLDRKNNNGNYEPSNCKWETRKNQSRNTRRNLVLEYKGESKCLAEWVEVLELENYRAILKRILYRKWSVEIAFETPIKSKT